jgi:hypothetical protein
MLPQVKSFAAAQFARSFHPANFHQGGFDESQN